MVKCYSNHGQVLFQPWLSVIPTMVKCYSNHGQVLFQPWSSVIPTMVKCYSKHLQVLFQPWSSVIPTIFKCYSNHGQVLFQPWSSVMTKRARLSCLPGIRYFGLPICITWPVYRNMKHEESPLGVGVQGMYISSVSLE